MKKKKIAVLATTQNILRFLKRFFKTQNIYIANYFNKPELFINYIGATPPSLVIIEESFLEIISDKVTKFSTIVIISGNTKKGIENVINHNLNVYIYRPYFIEDLKYKLELTILERESREKFNNEMQELEVLSQISQLISNKLNPKDMLFQIVSQIAKIMPVKRCSIIRVDWLHRYAFVVASFEDPDITGIKLDLKKYPEILEALKTKGPVVIKDTLSDPLMRSVRDVLAPIGISSILIVPIVFREKIIGTLFLRTSRKDHTFSEQEIKLLSNIASASANTLYNAFLFEQTEDEKVRLEKLAVTDYLTGIYNVRYFYHRIIEEFSRCHRYSLPISCLMIDIDHFKKINDAYGHKIGDLVLKEFAQTLKKLSRKSDVLARYGGEEFIILLPQTPITGAISEAKRISKYLRRNKYKSLGNKTGLTVSIGIASYPNVKIKTHDDLISFSDNALFSAKEKGRNQVVVYGQ